MQEKQILIAGFGGQGVVALGNIIARACMFEGCHVTGMVSYGAEMRGGTCNATIVISNEEIACPVVENPAYAIILNSQSLERYEKDVAASGLVVLNTSMIQQTAFRPDLTRIEVPATDIAFELGNRKGANMVALGAFIQHTGLLNMDSIERGMRELFGGKNPVLIEQNVRALYEGTSRYKLIKPM